MDAALTGTEVVIKSIWSELLEVDDIERNQSFFELGGNSLTMIDMLSEVGKAFEVDLDPSLLFEDASLHGFSKLVDTFIMGCPNSGR